MLDKMTFTTTVVPGPVVRTGQSVAKTHYSDPRARGAAAWFLGVFIMTPTVKQAEATFHVCPALVPQEVAKLKATITTTSTSAASISEVSTITIDDWWADLTPVEQAEFAARNLGSVWTAVETATSN